MSTRLSPLSWMTEWLELLRCPQELAQLRWLGGEETRDGVLECHACGRRFPVIDGIVRCVSEQLDDQRKLEEMRARDEQAASYEQRYNGKQTDAEVIPLLLGRLSPAATDTVADLGCGTGMITRLYAPQVRRVIGVDFSLASLQFLRRHLPPELQSRVLLVHADVCALPLAHGRFDKAVSSEVIHHLPTAMMRQTALETVAALLKPGGAFTCSVYNWSWHKRSKARRGLTDYSFKEGMHASNIYYYNFEAAELRRLIAQAGLEPRAMQGMVIGLPGSNHLGALGHWLRKLVARTPLGVKCSQLLLCQSVRRSALFWLTASEYL